MLLTKYTTKDYAGKFNLLTNEKALITRALKQSKESRQLCKILEINEKQLLTALVRHQITISS